MSAHGTYAHGILRSALGMSLPLDIAAPFRYLGSLNFDLAAGARVERHVFVDGAREVARLIVVQFEAFLAGVDDHYRYPLRDVRMLAGEAYGRSAGELSVERERADAPDAEIAHTAAFLESRGLVLPDRHAVARYARIVGEERRKEILIFYQEVGGRLEGLFERAERALGSEPVARSRATRSTMVFR